MKKDVFVLRRGKNLEPDTLTANSLVILYQFVIFLENYFIRVVRTN